MTDSECFLRRAKISFAFYEGMLVYLYMWNKDRLLFFTRFITFKAIKPAQLEAKTIIILELNNCLTIPEMSDDSNLSSGGEEAALN